MNRNPFIDYFYIVLNREDSTYPAGATVLGTLDFRVRQRMRLNYVKVNSWGNTYFNIKDLQTTNKKKNKKDDQIPKDNFLEYFRYDTVFLDAQSSPDYFIEPGQYSFEIQVYLPANLPSSIDNERFRTKYGCTAELSTPDGPPLIASKTYTVIRQVDLNDHMVLRNPYVETRQATYCCLCCKSKPLVVSMTVKKGAYVPGETIICDLRIHNRTGRDVKSPKLAFAQEVRFNTPSKSETTYIDLVPINLNKDIKKNTYEEFPNIQIRVPPTCPTYMGASRIMEVNYVIKAEFAKFRFGDELKLTIPILIGTIPYRSSLYLSAGHAIHTWEVSPKESGNRTIRHTSENLKQGSIMQDDFNFYAPRYMYYPNVPVDIP